MRRLGWQRQVELYRTARLVELVSEYRVGGTDVVSTHLRIVDSRQQIQLHRAVRRRLIGRTDFVRTSRRERRQIRRLGTGQQLDTSRLREPLRLQRWSRRSD